MLVHGVSNPMKGISMADVKTIATDVPSNPPDFRIFTAANGECVHCPVPHCRGIRFEVFLSDTAVTLLCGECKSETHIVANKLAE